MSVLPTKSLVVFHAYPVASGTGFQFQTMVVLVAVWIAEDGASGADGEMV